MRNGRAVDRHEPERGEEPRLEREAEDPGNAELTRHREQLGDDPVADLAAAAFRRHRDRTDLSQVLPHHVQRAAADHLVVLRSHGDPELLHRLVQRDRRLAEQPTVHRVRVDERPDRLDVRGPGAPDVHVHGYVPSRGTQGPSAHQGPTTAYTSSPNGLTPGPAASACARWTCRHFTRSGMPPAETPSISGTSPSAERRLR